MPCVQKGGRMMNETEIRSYAGLMKELGLTGLEIETDQSRLRLEYPVTALHKETGSASESEAVPQQAKQQRTEAADDSSVIRSPLVGVFYAAPEQTQPPYVKTGDFVKKGQILCIVEAMKLMNEIAAETDGVITEICVENGQMVEYGTELFRIKRQG